MTHRKLNAGSVAERVDEFFAHNPDEELTFEQLRDKFGLKRHTAYRAIGHLVAVEKLEFVSVIRPVAKGRAS